MISKRSTTSDCVLPAGISVVVPVYNSENTLQPLATRLAQVLDALALPYEVVLVNDGSRDKSWSVTQSLAREHDWIHGIDLLRNHGQHNALLCGIREARYATCITIDDDLQNPPEEIPKLMAMLEEGFDVVYGSPAAEQHGLMRDLASQITKLVLQRAMGAATARKISAFRVFRTELRQAFAEYRSPYVCIDVLLTWGTSRFTSLTVAHEPRQVGRSNYTGRKLITHALNMVTGFSILPLQIAGMIGFFFAIFGMGVLAYVLGRYMIQGTTVSGFPFLASIIAIFSGAQLFALGIIGEYLARMHVRAMERPVYTVRRSTASSVDSETLVGEA